MRSFSFEQDSSLGKAPSRVSETSVNAASGPASILQLQQAAGNQAVLQLRSNLGLRNPEPANGPSISTNLPNPLRSRLELQSGVDLSGVRVYRNSPGPGRVNAHAYTHGQNIHLGPGQDHQLEHEGRHAVQQMQGRVTSTSVEGGLAVNTDSKLEKEADQNGSETSESAGKTPAVIQKKLKITGLTEAKRKAFVTKMSDGSKTKFQIDATGLVEQVDKKVVETDEYSKQIVAAINDAQTVNLNLIDQSDAVFGDSFATGQVDNDDMMGMSEKLFLSNVMHFIVERFATPDYEKNKAKTSKADFNKAHGKGQDAQEKQMKEWFPKKNIKYAGQGYDASSKVVDAAGNGSIEYFFDFTDVKQVFKQNIVGGAVKESIISSRIDIVR